MRQVLLMLVLAIPAFPATYYVDPQNTLGTSADSNNGTSKATAWIHAPGMTGCSSTCNSTTLNAGDSVIVRGGTTIPSSYIPWVLPSRNGSAGNLIYYGTDQTWYSGGSFTRPIINFGNPTSSNYISSCTVDDTSIIGVSLSSLQYIQFDDFELTGFCVVTAPSFGNGVMLKWTTGTHLLISNLYIHGWTQANGSGIYPTVILGANTQTATNNVFKLNVVDGSDTKCSGVNACTAWFDYGEGYDIESNYIAYISNGVNSPGNIFTIHDNIFDHIYESADGTQHGGVIESQGEISSTDMFIYNNIFRYGNPGVGIWPEPASNLYEFNNVDFQYRDGTSGANCYLVDRASNSNASVAVYFFNNTTDAPCVFTFYGQHSPQFNGTGTFQNNHFIGTYAALSDFWGVSGSTTVCGSPPCVTVTDNGNQVFQSEVTANGQGYVQGNNYAPTLASNATIGVGGNLTTFCNGLSDATASAACKKGIAGITYNSSSHTVTANTANSRGTAWDTGAYQFQAPPGSQWTGLTGTGMVIQ